MDEVIERLRALKFDIVLSPEDDHDLAICAVRETAVAFTIPHQQHERGWNEAKRLAAAKGAIILADIAFLIDDYNRLKDTLEDSWRGDRGEY